MITAPGPTSLCADARALQPSRTTPRRWSAEATAPGGAQWDGYGQRVGQVIADDPSRLLVQRSAFRCLRERHVVTREELGEVPSVGLDRRWAELAKQRVGGFAGERADVQRFQVGAAGPERVEPGGQGRA